MDELENVDRWGDVLSPEFIAELKRKFKAGRIAFSLSYYVSPRDISAPHPPVISLEDGIDLHLLGGSLEAIDPTAPVPSWLQRVLPGGVDQGKGHLLQDQESEGMAESGD